MEGIERIKHFLHIIYYSFEKQRLDAFLLDSDNTFIDKAFTAAQSEMKQLHLRDTFKKHLRELAQTQRHTVLESHMFLKEKRDGKIKGRTVAGGNKQRDYISKEDASSPTVATESVLLSCIIDAEEERWNPTYFSSSLSS
jgi:hypothetical protein